ncbi:methylenetetrahydrofolate reductase [Novosphingobium sp. 9]|uniref:methylenetetrahydrofolate reductase n=1 Tax=Novosphingobium sp. 9 TaxID=2025349 RepID=UPI0021B6B749|nr:methylenetetrahydrofolate reductase [Novosphingobium sp. 9]
MVSVKVLLEGYSLETTVADAGKLADLPGAMPRPQEVYVPYLANEDDAARLRACQAVRAAGLEPVPHFSARRIASLDALDSQLAAMALHAGVTRAFVIAGDIARPEGPFMDSLSLIGSGLFEKHGFTHIGVAGHPDGHPDVAQDVLWSALDAKLQALSARGIEARIVTQFSFDPDRVADWIGDVRARGITAPIRIGIPGPTSVRTLLRYAARCGVTASASAVAKYGFSLSRLLGQAGPDDFIAKLGARLDPAADGPASDGVVRLHVFPFGGFDKVGGWIAGVLADSAHCTA